jgi:hypothetical protein
MKNFNFIFNLLLITLITKCNTEIIFVFEHFRHGARSSVFIDKHNTDIYDIKWIGDGELTSVGMRMLYLIGVHIRTKYHNIINKYTSSEELIVYSTDLNRTILSAESQLLGMFPPEKGEIIEDAFKKYSFPPNEIPLEAQSEIDELGNVSIPSKIRAIPINFFHKEKKPYLLTEESDCPRTKYIKQQNYKKKDVQDFIKNFREKYDDKWMEYFNIKDKSIFDNYYFLLEVTDHFISSYIHKRKNLKFFEDEGINLKEYYEECIKFKNISMYEIETTQELGIMAASPIFKEMLYYMDNIINLNIKNDTEKKNKTTKFIMYSGHDYIIAAVQLYLNSIFNTPCFYPGFAANQFFELHKSDNANNSKLKEEDFYLQYLYNGELILNVSYSEFKKKIMNKMWSMAEIIDFCKVEKYSFVDYLLYLVIGFSTISISYAIIKENISEKKKNTVKNRYPIYKNYQTKRFD